MHWEGADWLLSDIGAFENFIQSQCTEGSKVPIELTISSSTPWAGTECGGACRDYPGPGDHGQGKYKTVFFPYFTRQLPTCSIAP